MITTKHLRNALTGALALMTLGLFASCSQDLVAPLDEDPALATFSATLEEAPAQDCKLVDGVWVCSSVESTTTSDGDSLRQHCELIGGVLYCEPVGGG